MNGSGQGQQQGLAAAAANPSTDQHVLREIAQHYPTLRPIVAGNPNSYPGLLAWLAGLGDPAVDAALAARGAAPAPSVPSMPPAPVNPGLATPVAGIPGVAQAPSRADTEVIPPVAQTLQFAPVGASNAPAVTSTWYGASTGSGTDSPWGTAATSPQGRGADALPMASEPRPRRRIVGIIAVAALVVVAVGLVVALSQIFLNDPFQRRSTVADQAPSTIADTPASDGRTSQSSDEGAPVVSDSFDAPAGAVVTDYFVSPSGNIECFIHQEGLFCTIREHGWAAGGYESCSNQSGANLLLTAGSAGIDCRVGDHGMDWAPPTLPYGSYADLGEYACYSATEGVSCWSSISGKAIALSRSGWMTGDTGQIPASRFTF